MLHCLRILEDCLSLEYLPALDGVLSFWVVLEKKKKTHNTTAV